jgi:hypothetical protein
MALNHGVELVAVFCVTGSSQARCGYKFVGYASQRGNHHDCGLVYGLGYFLEV